MYCCWYLSHICTLTVGLWATDDEKPSLCLPDSKHIHIYMHMNMHTHTHTHTHSHTHTHAQTVCFFYGKGYQLASIVASGFLLYSTRYFYRGKCLGARYIPHWITLTKALNFVLCLKWSKYISSGLKCEQKTSLETKRILHPANLGCQNLSLCQFLLWLQ